MLQQTNKIDGAKMGDNQEAKELKGLLYPFSEVPEFGTAKEITDGVFWLRMPLGGSLAWINIWLLRDNDGWTLVDTGMNNSKSQEAWKQVIENVLEGKPIKRIIGTHMHPDHVGLVGWLNQFFDLKLYMSRLEYFYCRMLAADTGRVAPKEAIDFYTKAGWPQDALETYKSRFGNFGRMMSELPQSFYRLEEGNKIEIGNYVWEVIIGNGHSPEHVCLYQKELKLLISGDQILPKISSNISVFPTEPEANPMRNWLDSCQKLIDLIPNDVLVLPAHNEPFIGVHERLNNLILHHGNALDRISALAKDKDIETKDCFSLLFRRPITSDNISMATGETIAHLNYLVQEGKILRELKNGLYCYSAVK